MPARNDTARRRMNGRLVSLELRAETARRLYVEAIDAGRPELVVAHLRGNLERALEALEVLALASDAAFGARVRETLRVGPL